MKLKMLMDRHASEIESAVNEWLSGGKIEILKTELTMTNVAGKPNDGTYPCVVLAVWYVELAN